MSEKTKNKSKTWAFLNSNIFLLIFGFVLTTILGTFLSDRLQTKAWERQSSMEKERQDYEWKREKKFELLRRKLDEGQSTLEEISDLINIRFYRLQNTYINIAQGNISAANASWKAYFKTVEEWNVKLIIYQNKIRRLVSEDEANLFNNYETDNASLESAESLHGQFYIVHQSVLDLLRCLRRSNCQITQSEKDKVHQLLRALDYESDAFIDRISDEFLRRTLELESF